eukprot:7377846-Ditylum_brightwellii.AAC.1
MIYGQGLSTHLFKRHWGELMSGEHQLMYWSISFKRVESRFLSGNPGVEEEYLWVLVPSTLP